jgi:hypothetical protein
MYEEPTARRLGSGVIVMLVVLAAVTGTMAYLVARQVLAGRGDNPTVTERDPSTPIPGTTSDAGPGPTSPAPASSEPATEPPATRGPDQSRPNDGESCPKLTADALAAKGLNAELNLLLYVEFTTVRGKARVWICRNADDVLVYQAHERSSEFDAADNAINTLLLAQGIKGSVSAVEDGFLARNPGPGGTVTEYTATPETFSIVVRPDGAATSVPVTKVITPG